METAGKSRQLLRIHRDDNVLIVVAPIRPRDTELLDGSEVIFGQNISIGHKIAARKIAAGMKVIRCGVPIGSAKSDIMPGDHVNLHNVNSDYLSTYTLDKEHVFVK
jgi:D-threo-aldose 1-dehydrogenase